MPTELIEALTALADEWDTAAPAITLEELTPARWTSNEAPPTSPEVDVLTVPHRRRGWWIAATVAAAIALVVVAVTVIGRNDPDRRIQPPVDSDLSSTTIAPTTTAVLGVEEQLADVQRHTLDALARLGSFSATVISTTDVNGANAHTTTERVTVMADGKTWSESDPELSWSSYDPVTGVRRFGSRLDGYSETTGTNPESTPPYGGFGLDVAAPFVPWDIVTIRADHVTITAVDSHLERSAWRIDMTGPEPGGLQAWVIDRATGLVVEQRWRDGSTGAPMSTPGMEGHTVLDDLLLDVALPSAFPGTFPEGATVHRNADTAGFHLATVAEAAKEFGSPIAVPAGFPDDATVQVISQQLVGAVFLQVTAETHEGFIRTHVTTSKGVPTPGAPVPGDATVIDGLLCAKFTRNCVDSSPTVVATGALAGRPMTEEVAQATVEIGDGGVLFKVVSADEARALAATASLRLVGP